MAERALNSIDAVRITRFEYPRSRIIGDASVQYDTNWFATVELIDQEGRSGLGALFSLNSPLPSEATLQELAEKLLKSKLRGRQPVEELHRVAHLRGNLAVESPFGLDDAANQALWDLAAKQADLPLWRFFGAEKGRATCYASGLCFGLSDELFQRFYADATARGFRAFKIKVGGQPLARDLHRLRLLHEVVTEDSIVMIDANESWTAREAIRRLRAYEQAGLPVFWAEDPIWRYDFAGLQDIRAACPNVYVNAGEYLPTNARCELIARRAADVVNVHSNLSDCLRVAWLASEANLHVTFGNTPFDMGAHLAAALPHALYVEHAFLNVDEVLRTPLIIIDGAIVLSERPGHGLEISEEARMSLRKPG